MAIILEGPDAAGKTTLGRLLQGQFGMHLIVSGGAPRTEQEVIGYCEMQLAQCYNKGAVIDRITPISHPIYNPKYVGHPAVAAYLKEMVEREDVAIVYCRPPTEALMRPEKHVWKDYDTEDHKKKVLEGQMTFIQRYDEVFRSIPHLCYDYTMSELDEMHELVCMLAATQNSSETMRELRQLQVRGPDVKC